MISDRFVELGATYRREARLARWHRFAERVGTWFMAAMLIGGSAYVWVHLTDALRRAVDTCGAC